MYNVLYIINNESDYIKAIEQARNIGATFPNENIIGAPSFVEAKKYYHGNSKLLLHVFLNSITNKIEMQFTTKSTLLSYPQYTNKTIKSYLMEV